MAVQGTNPYFEVNEQLINESINLYDIENVSFNSKYSDFGPFMKGNKLYFTSERRVDEIINYQYSY